MIFALLSPPPPPARLWMAPPAFARALVTSITIEAAMIGMEEARLALQCREDDLMEWIAAGDLEWVFDFRRGEARRAHVRILTESVARLQRRARRWTWQERVTRRRDSFVEIFGLLFKHHRPFLRSSELAGAWNCGASHIHNLVDDGLLPVAKKDYALREPFLISRAAAARFMDSRRMS